ncbi:DUF1287 domain-containing protein [Moheibacter lacus]|uniref:DUF1287 domain-containing protein n=1 Tax=Moheibacter lacus TaxID=2745851 RepID=A0A838ZS39_9FLAO|nr:DUF1287 domain-containing protein [Moheibacter lacus]MBA5628869.1 DUF1287 domain-containing protein [Moheibacter lacus]
MKIQLLVVFVSFLLFQACKSKNSQSQNIETERNENLSEEQQKISDAAISIVDPTIVYDPSYFVIPYPNGEIPEGKGVCTDVVVRTYRALGIDLQKEVHEDMAANFSTYPKIWGLTKPDTNIDHRRVPNLMVFFSRFGTEKPMTKDAEDYLPGDIVCWRLQNGMTHIGVVVDKLSKDKNHYQIVHNIGSGQVLEDVLFDYEIIGHYFYAPNSLK